MSRYSKEDYEIDLSSERVDEAIEEFKIYYADQYEKGQSFGNCQITAEAFASYAKALDVKFVWGTILLDDADEFLTPIITELLRSRKISSLLLNYKKVKKDLSFWRSCIIPLLPLATRRQMLSAYHCWNVTGGGRIIDLTGRSQFVEPGYLSDLAADRYQPYHVGSAVDCDPYSYRARLHKQMVASVAEALSSEKFQELANVHELANVTDWNLHQKLPDAGKKRAIPDVLYHGTSSKNLNKIKQYGLKQPYLTPMYGLAEYYAGESCEELGGQPIILKLRKIEYQYLLYDANAMDEPVMVDEAQRDDAWENAGKMHPDWVDQGLISVPMNAWEISLEGAKSVHYEKIVPWSDLEIVSE
jgi:hypothetical protein